MLAAPNACKSLVLKPCVCDIVSYNSTRTRLLRLVVNRSSYIAETPFNRGELLGLLIENRTCYGSYRAAVLSLVDGELSHGGSMSLNLTAPCEFSLIVKRQGASLPSTR